LGAEEKEVDFDVIKEDWSRYRIEDGTILRLRINVIKIIRGKMGDLGYPEFGIHTRNLISALVKDDLKGEPSKEPLKIPQDIEKELKFKVIEEKLQEYITRDGYKISVKPVLLKVFRTKKFNQFGEPIYVISSHAIINVEKLR